MHGHSNKKSPFKSAGASVQSTAGSRGVRISGSNAGYTMFRDSVKSTGYSIHSLVSPSLPLPASPCAITFQLDSTTGKTPYVASTTEVKGVYKCGNIRLQIFFNALKDYKPSQKAVCFSGIV